MTSDKIKSMPWVNRAQISFNIDRDIPAPAGTVPHTRDVTDREIPRIQGLWSAIRGQAVVGAAGTPAANARSQAAAKVRIDPSSEKRST